jgi:hypothetical protein
VKDGGKAVPESEYRVAYQDNVEAGTGKVIITDAKGGNYIVSGSKAFTILKRKATVTAKNQSVKVGERISIGVDQVKLEGQVKGHVLDFVKLEDSGTGRATDKGRITVRNAKIVDAKGRDVTENYALKYTSGKLTVIEEAAPQPDYTFLAYMSTCGSKALRVAWSPVSGADGYDVYLTKADSGYSMGEYASVRNGTRVKFTGLKKKTAYKAYVRAWKRVDGKRVYIGKESPTVYAITGGYNSKYCNARSLALNTGRTLSLKVGETKTVKATVKGVKGSKKVYHKANKVRWYSSDRNVATVSGKGKIKAIGKGSCVIWAIANNGVRSRVKVRVK